MVFVEMGGRCGNQFFHYAVARYIQIKTNDTNLVLNYNPVWNQNREKEGWYDVLTEYKTVPYSYYSKHGTVLKNETNLVQKIMVGIKSLQISLNKNKSRQVRAEKNAVGQRALNFTGVYWVREGVNKVEVYPRKKSIVTGPCEASFIYEIQSILQTELVPRNDVLPQNMKLIDDIRNSESVCVSVRRGDFFNNKNQKSFGVCNEAYYIKAIKLMKEKLNHKNNVKFYVFSDDIEWCKSHIPVGGGMGIYVSQNMPVYETLRLMYTCKHFVLSNSTFSWWGQFLSTADNKIVVSPSRWNNDGYNSVLIGKDWILIDC